MGITVTTSQECTEFPHRTFNTSQAPELAPPLPEPPHQATKLRGAVPAKFWTQGHSVYMLCPLCVLFLLASCPPEAQLRGRLVNLFTVLVADNCVQVNICVLTVAFDTAPLGRLGLQARNLDGMTLVRGAFLLQLHPTLLSQAWPSRLWNSCLACKPPKVAVFLWLVFSAKSSLPMQGRLAWSTACGWV